MFNGTETEEHMFEQVLNHWTTEKDNIFMWQKFMCLKQGIAYQGNVGPED